MALATTLLQDPQSALTALLSQGIGALNAAVNHSINVGRDRATTQLNQENTVFNVLKNENDLRQRRAENLRRGYETDRLFGLQTFEAKSAAEARTTAAQQAAQRLELDTQRVGLEAQRLSASKEEAKSVAEARTTAAQQAGQRLELESQRTGAELLRLQEVQRQTDLLRERNERTRSEALGSTTSDALIDPQAARTLTTPDLESYVDFFGGVAATDPAVAARVNTARRELSRRNPDIDPNTGRKIPDRFAPDRTNPFEDRPAEEHEFIARELKDEIDALEAILNDPKTKTPAKTTIIKELSKKREQLRKAPVSVQKKVLGEDLTIENPATKTVEDWFDKK